MKCKSVSKKSPRYKRAYEINSKAVSTTDQMLQKLTQL
ncbi:flagellar basal body rod C-terminal domain-containing protein [Escherichia coli]